MTLWVVFTEKDGVYDYIPFQEGVYLGASKQDHGGVSVGEQPGGGGS